MSQEPLLSLEHLSAHYVSQQGTRVVARLGTFALPFGFSHLSPPVGTLPSGSYTLVAKGWRGPALSAAFRVG